MYQQALQSRSCQPLQPTLSSAEAHALYQTALQAAAVTSRASISTANRKRRDNVISDLEAFLHRLPYQTTLQNCAPEDIIVYLTSDYIPHHAGSLLPDGKTIVAPSTISNILSHLRMSLKELGRGDSWDEKEQSGNPCCAHRVQQWSSGYDKESKDSGFQSTGAKELTEEKMVKLLTYLTAQCLGPSANSSHDRALAARDAFVFCLMWQTGMRSVNACNIRLQDFMLPGQPRGSVAALIFGVQQPSQPLPSKIEVQPARTKTHQSNPFRIAISRHSNPLLDSMHWLKASHILAAQADAPIQDYLVRPALKCCKGFKDQPLTPQSLAARLKVHLSQIGQYEGESRHSFRRGMAQHRTDQGESQSSVQKIMLLKSAAIMKNRYLPKGRHNSGVKRVRSFAGQATPAMPPEAVACQQTMPVVLQHLECRPQA